MTSASVVEWLEQKFADDMKLIAHIKRDGFLGLPDEDEEYARGLAMSHYGALSAQMFTLKDLDDDDNEIMADCQWRPRSPAEMPVGSRLKVPPLDNWEPECL